MLDVDEELPYVVWYQCKSCTHLFYNEQSKILSHLRDKHGYGLIDSHSQSQQKNIINSARSIKSMPLKIKEQHFRPVAPSTSSGTDGDGEDNYADDIINNNNNYPTSITLSKRKPRYFLPNDTTFEQHVPLNHTNRNSKSTVNVAQVMPSIEDIKKQLMKSDIDISEIKLGNHSNNIIPEEEFEDYEGEDVDDDPEVEEGEPDEGIEYTEDIESQGYGFHSESYEDQEQDSEDQEEAASTSNQSYYDNDMGDHFLLKNEADSEYNYDDEGMMTPNFNMVDELYRANEAASSAMQSTSVRKRTNLNPCKLCKRNFPSLSMLKKHAKTHLNDEGGSQHVCKFCFEYFPSAAGLSKHLRVHSKENPNVCRVCSKSFTSWATLRTHLKIHSGERPFGCSQCGQRFQTKSTLDSHLRIHSGSRPHVCPICSKSFRTSSPLYRHIRAVHKGMTTAPVENS